jgi:coenzyme F420-reducing hydrogenase alpha subunit
VEIEGSLRIRVEWDGDRIRAVGVQSTRPDFVHDLLDGRRADEAEALLPRVFSICARAQAAATATALDAARGTLSPAARHRQMNVLAEIALEYLWRLQIDLPGLLGLPQRPAALARLKHELDRNGGASEDWMRFIVVLRAAIEEECAGARFDTGDLRANADWEAAGDAPVARVLRALRAVPPGPSETSYLPRMSDTCLRAIGNALERDPAYAKHPRYADAPAECGARARLAGHPLWQSLPTGTSRAYQRVLARWIELVDIPAELTRLLEGEPERPCVLGITLAPGCGIAGVETARGLLVHAAELAHGRVRRYRIVAPTEWNFHPLGALPADLTGVPARTLPEAEQLARLAVQSLDPCVRYTLEVEQRDA